MRKGHEVNESKQINKFRLLDIFGRNGNDVYKFNGNSRILNWRYCTT